MKRRKEQHTTRRAFNSHHGMSETIHPAQHTRTSNSLALPFFSRAIAGGPPEAGRWAEASGPAVLPPDSEAKAGARPKSSFRPCRAKHGATRAPLSAIRTRCIISENPRKVKLNFFEKKL